MKNKIWLAIAGVAATGIVAAILLYPATEVSQSIAMPRSATEQSNARALGDPLSGNAAPLTTASTISLDAVPAATDSDEPGKIAFKVADGKIVTDEQARLDLEKLYALYTEAEREKKLKELEQELPSSADQHLRELMQQYIHYQTAQYQAVPPGREMTTEAEGLQELDTLHGLQVQYFGEQAANGFYGEEEKISRELLRLMSLEKDLSLTMEEKTERAQALYPTLAAVNAAEERGQREAATAEKNKKP